MSLINDALKKAQRQRASAGAAAPGAGPSDGSALVKRRQPLAARSVVLIAGGALVLVMAAVTATIFLVTDTPPPPRPRPTRIANAKPTADQPSAISSPSPVISPPSSVVSVPPSSITGNPDPITDALSASRPPPSAVRPPSSVISSPSAPAPDHESPLANNAATQPRSPAVTFAIPQPDERVNAFLDRLHVTGIRSSGADSKVLMNDRVYRVNDLVDRTLALKLVKVEDNTLTFEDANGLTYTKTF